MSFKEFIDKYGVNLIIESNKNNIIFKTDSKNVKRDCYLNVYFNKEVFEELIKYTESISNKIWNDFTPKEADSISSDYAEYYDRKYDNNGCLSIIENFFRIERPCIECPYMYKFNKRRMESFMYDLNK